MRPRPRIALVSFIVLVAACLVVLWVQVGREEARRDAGSAAMRTARSSLEALLAYTPDTVDSDLEVELNLLTGDFRTDYERLVRDVVSPAAIKGKVSTTASIVDAGVVSAEAERATLLVFVNVTSRAKALAEPRLSGSRLRVRMLKVGSTWLISGMDPV